MHIKTANAMQFKCVSNDLDKLQSWAKFLIHWPFLCALYWSEETGDLMYRLFGLSLHYGL